MPRLQVGEITRSGPASFATLTNAQLAAEFERLSALDASPELNAQLAYLYAELHRRNVAIIPPKYEGFKVVRPENRVWQTPSYWM